MSEKLSIKIRIADRDYPMQIDAEMESKLRQAGKVLNDKLNKYAQSLGIQNKQDLLAMVAFDCMVELIGLQADNEEAQAILAHKIAILNDLASSAL